MIIVINTIPLPKPITQDEARKIFLSTAPKYQDIAGLVRKCYVLSPDGRTAGGIYLWDSRVEADAMYTESWKAFVREKYGAEPSVTYLDCPVIVDNLTHEIISDEELWSLPAAAQSTHAVALPDGIATVSANYQIL